MTCLGIGLRNATRWADTRSRERISCFIKVAFHTYISMPKLRVCIVP